MNERRRSRLGRARIVRVVLLALAAGFVLGRAFHGRADHAGKAAASAETLWTCGMHPNVLQKEPGECPLCHMKLTPLVRGTDAAMVFQEPSTALNPVYPVGWQIAEGLRAHGKYTRREARAKAIDILRRVGIPDPEVKLSVTTLSQTGGLSPA